MLKQRTDVSLLLPGFLRETLQLLVDLCSRWLTKVFCDPHGRWRLLPGFLEASANAVYQMNSVTYIFPVHALEETSGLDCIAAASFPAVSFNSNSLESSAFLLNV